MIRDSDGKILGVQATEHGNGTVTLAHAGVAVTVEQNAGAIADALTGFGHAAALAKITPFQFSDLHEQIVKTGAAFEQLGARLKTVGADVYPLYCVDRGDREDPSIQYRGPYATHDEAQSNTEDPRDLARRCRQLRPSEIAFDHDTESLAEVEVFEAFVDALDEAAQSGNLPEGAWYRINARVVFAKYDDDTFPDARNYETWVNDHLSVDAWICEGDE